MEALSEMGREPFRRLRRAVGRTATPSPSGDEGGSGPSGAQTVSDPYRLDPAVNAENQVTAPSGANLNNLDPATDTYAFLAAVSSPVASMATQDPLWPPSLGETTSLDDYLAEQSQGTAPTTGGTTSTSAPTAGLSLSPATAPTTRVATQAQPGDAPPTLGEGTRRKAGAGRLLAGETSIALRPWRSWASTWSSSRRRSSRLGHRATPTPRDTPINPRIRLTPPSARRS